jgi:hypothetical protein
MSLEKYEITPNKEGKFMSNIMLRLVQRTIYLTLFYLGWTLLAAAAGRTNITGTWNLDQLENDKSDQKAQQIVGSRADLTDSVADQRDQRETARGMPNDRILLMMAGISSLLRSLSSH